MKKQIIPLLFLFSLVTAVTLAQKDSAIVRKEYITTRAENSPKIDGVLDDDTWKGINTITDFRQNSPVFNIPVSQKNEVKIVYDNTAIYIAATLFDTSPDSIAHQLGNRDDYLNADMFQIKFDTYNKEQDAFIFGVAASGVQVDSRFSDDLYNAVWESATKITKDGWVIEIKIPFSALRFPNAIEQIWGFQITRNITRNGEFDQFALTPKGESNIYKYWGLLTGIKNIKQPIRLSLTPYLTAYTSHYPANIQGESNYSSHVTGGLDLKYGLNGSFTVDASLLPDFSQVQSDNVVKNLGAFEIQYQEQRPFFNEGTELFQKGDLFYSRRIGREPTNYNYVSDSLHDGEKIIKNPNQAKLINGTKISGRTVNGMGIGLLNAVLNNTYAIAKDSLGKERKILTEPFSNYNIVVFDQQLKNSSSVYLINSNVTRKMNYSNADVTGAGIDLKNKKARYGINASTAISNVFTKSDTILNQYTDLFGHKYDLSINKISGNFQFSIFNNAVNPTFNNNALGITNETNFMNSGVNIHFYQFEPRGILLNSSLSFLAEEYENFTTHRTNSINFNLNENLTFRNFYHMYFGCDASPLGNIDYYEARVSGRIFRRTPGYTGFAGINSDSRKRLSVSLNVHAGSTTLISKTIGYNPYYGANINNSIRVNNKLSFVLYIAFHIDDGDRGWVNMDPYDNIIFGVRKMNVMENILEARYLFRNNLSLILRARQYWVKAHYKSFYNLTDEGYLIDNISYTENHDFNFNAFNIDMNFQWQFAPGSSLNFVWKNSINDERDKVVNSYSENFISTFQANQLNTVSLKILYYFDYLYLRKKHL